MLIMLLCTLVCAPQVPDRPGLSDPGHPHHLQGARDGVGPVAAHPGEAASTAPPSPPTRLLLSIKTLNSTLTACWGFLFL